jgi:hypothetical protein
MKSTGISVVTLVPLVMAAFSLFSMMGMLQIDRIVHHDLYNYGLNFNIGWAKPYWDTSAFVFATGWFNIILAVAFQLYVLTYGRREAKQFATEVKKEILNLETNPPTEKVGEQDKQASAPSEIQEKEQKETPEPLTEAETSEKKEEPQQVFNADQTSQEKVTPDQSVQGEGPEEQEPEASGNPETEQKDTTLETEEKEEETTIIIGMTEEERQPSS